MPNTGNSLASLAERMAVSRAKRMTGLNLGEAAASNRSSSPSSRRRSRPLAGLGLAASSTGFCRLSMAVGDDAQSIYAFRGATVDNILDFPDLFPGTTIIKLEENYRSTQPILTLTNAILQHAGRKYEKNLFTSRTDGDKPELVRPFSDLTQAAMRSTRVR